MLTFSQYNPWNHRGDNGYANPGIARSAASEFARIIMEGRDRERKKGITLVSIDRSSATLAVATQHALIDRGVRFEEIEWVYMDKTREYAAKKWVDDRSFIVFVDDYLSGGRGLEFAEKNLYHPLDLALYIKVPQGFIRESYDHVHTPIKYLEQAESPSSMW